MKRAVREKFEGILKQKADLEAELSKPVEMGRAGDFAKRAKELARLTRAAESYLSYRRVQGELEKAREILSRGDQDSEFLTLAKEEEARFSKELRVIEHSLEDLLLEGEDDPDRKIITEIRAGTGGEEACLFAGDLFRMYTYFCQSKNLKIETLSTSLTGLGGIKEVIFSVSGPRAWAYFKFESGTHRVQRVPETEASGRIHTSAVTVAVLPEVDEVELNLDPRDLRIDVYRSSGPGGQGVNTTDSAVRITHLETGLVVSCQDERSQLKNKNKGMRILRARLMERMKRERQQKISEFRKKQVGSGDRSEKIRTYNFPDRRVTDHRIGLTLHRLHEILEGDLDEMVQALAEKEREMRLAS